MKTLVLFICACFWATPIFGQADKAKLDGLGWLAGCWEGGKEASSRLFSEQWMKPAGGMMIGMGRTIQSGKAADWEFMRIEQTGDSLTFFSKPKANNAETAFKMLRIKDSEVVFENLSHDFPQRVIYRLTKQDTIVARIEGSMNGKERGIDFPYVRAKCG